MNRRFSHALALCISLSILLVACKKGDPGTPGLDGATGATGPAGPQGDKGDQGDSGVAGTANVYYSSWHYAVGFNDSTIDNSAIKVGYIPAEQVTTAILNSGAVLVYFTYGGGTFLLPYTSNAGGKPNTISYTPMNQKILVTRFTHDNSNSVALSTLLQYRYIVIPGGVSVGRSDGTKTGQATDETLPDLETLKAMPYESVCQLLSIRP